MKKSEIINCERSLDTIPELVILTAPRNTTYAMKMHL